MRLFHTYSRRVVVPTDSTVAEPFVLRCLANAFLRGDAPSASEQLTFALRSLHAAQRCAQQAAHRQPLTSDTLLDLLVPILYYKCRLPTLERALRACTKHVSADSGELHGEDGFSVCTLLAATRAAHVFRPH